MHTYRAKGMLCKTCHDDFDPEVVLKEALSDCSDEIFWVAIFANDIGAPLKPGRDETYHLTVDAVHNMTVKDIPVRYFHCSDPIGRVLFGWHIHWDDKPTFACACVATISQASFKAGAPVLLTIACQSSLGTVNGVPDEISITQLGARDDTVGLFCRRDLLRDTLNRFHFFDTNVNEPIKQDCLRASGIEGAFMNSAPTSTTCSVPTTAQSHSVTPAPPPAVNEERVGTAQPPCVAMDEHEHERKMSEIEDIAQQVRDIRETLKEQSEALNIIRGILEEGAVKSLTELRASEASAASKIRKDVERMMEEGVIRNLDNPDQPKVKDADAVQALVKYNMENFPTALAKSFRDAIEGIFEPPTLPSHSADPNPSDVEEIFPSIGSSLIAVRATALRAKTANDERGGITTTPEVPSIQQAQPMKRKSSSLQMIHEALAQRLVPGSKRAGGPSPYLAGYSRERSSLVDENNDNSKMRKMVQETIQGEMQRLRSGSQQPPERDEHYSLLREFLDFYQQREPQHQTPSQVHPAVATTSIIGALPETVPVIAQDSNAPPRGPSVQPVSSEQTTVRASGVSLQPITTEEPSNANLKELGIFY